MSKKMSEVARAKKIVATIDARLIGWSAGNRKAVEKYDRATERMLEKRKSGKATIIPRREEQQKKLKAKKALVKSYLRKIDKRNQHTKNMKQELNDFISKKL